MLNHAGVSLEQRRATACHVAASPEADSLNRFKSLGRDPALTLIPRAAPQSSAQEVFADELEGLALKRVQFGRVVRDLHHRLTAVMR